MNKTRAGKSAIVTALALLATVGTAEAQSRGLSAGDEVRLLVRGESSPIEGILSSISSEQWELSLPDGRVRTLAPEDVANAEVWATHGNARQGGLIGGGAGLVVGAIVGAQHGENCFDDGIRTCTGGDLAILTGLVFGAGGALVGAVIGTTVKTGEWVPGFAPAASPGGAGLALIWSLPVGF